MRAAWGSLLFHLRQERRTPGRVLLVTVAVPVLYTLLTFLLAGHVDERLAVRLGMGAGLVSLWGSLVGTATFSLTRERAEGTLDYLLLSPTPLAVVLVGRLSADLVQGLLAFVPPWIAIWGVAGGRGTDPFLWLAAFAPAASAFLGLGLLVAPLVALKRTFVQWINAAESPVWLLGGWLAPLGLLPRGIASVARLLVFHRIDLALAAAALGRVGATVGLWPSLVGWGAILTALGVLVLSQLERHLRRDPTGTAY